MKALAIITSAYRCNIEEQDDPAVWITGAMAGAGADFAVLLRGNAVSYAVAAQDAAGLSLGGIAQTQPPAPDADLRRMIGKGTSVYLVQEDLAERGVPAEALIDGVEPIARAALPGLLDAHEQVWHW